MHFSSKIQADLLNLGAFMPYGGRPLPLHEVLRLAASTLEHPDWYSARFALAFSNWRDICGLRQQLSSASEQLLLGPETSNAFLLGHDRHCEEVYLHKDDTLRGLGIVSRFNDGSLRAYDWLLGQQIRSGGGFLVLDNSALPSAVHDLEHVFSAVRLPNAQVVATSDNPASNAKFDLLSTRQSHQEISRNLRLLTGADKRFSLNSSNAALWELLSIALASKQPLYLGNLHTWMKSGASLKALADQVGEQGESAMDVFRALCHRIPEQGPLPDGALVHLFEAYIRQVYDLGVSRYAHLFVPGGLTIENLMSLNACSVFSFGNDSPLQDASALPDLVLSQLATALEERAKLKYAASDVPFLVVIRAYAGINVKVLENILRLGRAANTVVAVVMPNTYDLNYVSSGLEEVIHQQISAYLQYSPKKVDDELKFLSTMVGKYTPRYSGWSGKKFGPMLTRMSEQEVLLVRKGWQPELVTRPDLPSKRELFTHLEKMLAA